MIPRDDPTGSDIIRCLQRFDHLMMIQIGNLRSDGFSIYRKRYYYQEVTERTRGMECRLFCRFVMERRGAGGAMAAVHSWLDDVNSRGWSLRVASEEALRPGQIGILCTYQEKWIVGLAALDTVRRHCQSKQVKLMGKNMVDEAIYL